MRRAMDGSLYSVWTSNSAADEWLVMDVGAVLPVTRVEVDVTRESAKLCVWCLRLASAP